MDHPESSPLAVFIIPSMLQKNVPISNLIYVQLIESHLQIRISQNPGKFDYESDLPRVLPYAGVSITRGIRCLA